MTQPPEPPISTPAGRPPPAYPAALPHEAEHTRLYRAAAWVVIVAGILFVLAVVFFAGARFAGSGQPYRHHHHGMFGPDGPPPDGPPWVVFPGGPFPPGTGPGGSPWGGPWGPGMGPGGPGGPNGPGGHGGHGGHGGPEEPPPTFTP